MRSPEDERIEVDRFIAAHPAEIFAVLTDPQGHVDIDASGMLMDATGERVTGIGDRFEVHMDRERLPARATRRRDRRHVVLRLVGDRRRLARLGALPRRA